MALQSPFLRLQPIALASLPLGALDLKIKKQVIAQLKLINQFIMIINQYPLRRRENNRIRHQQQIVQPYWDSVEQQLDLINLHQMQAIVKDLKIVNYQQKQQLHYDQIACALGVRLMQPELEEQCYAVQSAATQLLVAHLIIAKEVVILQRWQATNIQIKESLRQQHEDRCKFYYQKLPALTKAECQQQQQRTQQLIKTELAQYQESYKANNEQMIQTTAMNLSIWLMLYEHAGHNAELIISKRLRADLAVKINWSDLFNLRSAIRVWALVQSGLNEQIAQPILAEWQAIQYSYWEHGHLALDLGFVDLAIQRYMKYYNSQHCFYGWFWPDAQLNLELEKQAKITLSRITYFQTCYGYLTPYQQVAYQLIQNHHCIKKINTFLMPCDVLLEEAERREHVLNKHQALVDAEERVLKTTGNVLCYNAVDLAMVTVMSSVLSEMIAATQEFCSSQTGVASIQQELTALTQTMQQRASQELPKMLAFLGQADALVSSSDWIQEILAHVESDQFNKVFEEPLIAAIPDAPTILYAIPPAFQLLDQCPQELSNPLLVPLNSTDANTISSLNQQLAQLNLNPIAGNLSPVVIFMQQLMQANSTVWLESATVYLNNAPFPLQWDNDKKIWYPSMASSTSTVKAKRYFDINSLFGWEQRYYRTIKKLQPELIALKVMSMQIQTLRAQVATEEVLMLTHSNLFAHYLEMMNKQHLIQQRIKKKLNSNQPSAYWLFQKAKHIRGRYQHNLKIVDIAMQAIVQDQIALSEIIQNTLIAQYNFILNNDAQSMVAISQEVFRKLYQDCIALNSSCQKTLAKTVNFTQYFKDQLHIYQGQYFEKNRYGIGFQVQITRWHTFIQLCADYTPNRQEQKAFLFFDQLLQGTQVQAMQADAENLMVFRQWLNSKYPASYYFKNDHSFYAQWAMASEILWQQDQKKAKKWLKNELGPQLLMNLYPSSTPCLSLLGNIKFLQEREMQQIKQIVDCCMQAEQSVFSIDVQLLYEQINWLYHLKTTAARTALKQIIEYVNNKLFSIASDYTGEDDSILPALCCILYDFVNEPEYLLSLHAIVQCAELRLQYLVKQIGRSTIVLDVADITLFNKAQKYSSQFCETVKNHLKNFLDSSLLINTTKYLKGVYSLVNHLGDAQNKLSYLRHLITQEVSMTKISKIAWQWIYELPFAESQYLQSQWSNLLLELALKELQSPRPQQALQWRSLLLEFGDVEQQVMLLIAEVSLQAALGISAEKVISQYYAVTKSSNDFMQCLQQRWIIPEIDRRGYTDPELLSVIDVYGTDEMKGACKAYKVISYLLTNDTANAMKIAQQFKTKDWHAMLNQVLKQENSGAWKIIYQFMMEQAPTDMRAQALIYYFNQMLQQEKIVHSKDLIDLLPKNIALENTDLFYQLIQDWLWQQLTLKPTLTASQLLALSRLAEIIYTNNANGKMLDHVHIAIIKQLLLLEEVISLNAYLQRVSTECLQQLQSIIHNHQSQYQINMMQQIYECRWSPACELLAQHINDEKTLQIQRNAWLIDVLKQPAFYDMFNQKHIIKELQQQHQQQLSVFMKTPRAAHAFEYWQACFGYNSQLGFQQVFAALIQYVSNHYNIKVTPDSVEDNWYLLFQQISASAIASHQSNLYINEWLTIEQSCQPFFELEATKQALLLSVKPQQWVQVLIKMIDRIKQQELVIQPSYVRAFESYFVQFEHFANDYMYQGNELNPLVMLLAQLKAPLKWLDDSFHEDNFSEFATYSHLDAINPFELTIQSGPRIPHYTQRLLFMANHLNTGIFTLNFTQWVQLLEQCVLTDNSVLERWISPAFWNDIVDRVYRFNIAERETVASWLSQLLIQTEKMHSPLWFAMNILYSLLAVRPKSYSYFSYDDIAQLNLLNPTSGLSQLLYIQATVMQYIRDHHNPDYVQHSLTQVIEQLKYNHPHWFQWAHQFFDAFWQQLITLLLHAPNGNEVGASLLAYWGTPEQQLTGQERPIYWQLAQQCMQWMQDDKSDAYRPLAWQSTPSEIVQSMQCLIAHYNYLDSAQQQQLATIYVNYILPYCWHSYDSNKSTNSLMHRDYGTLYVDMLQYIPFDWQQKIIKKQDEAIQYYINRPFSSPIELPMICRFYANKEQQRILQIKVIQAQFQAITQLQPTNYLTCLRWLHALLQDSDRVMLFWQILTKSEQHQLLRTLHSWWLHIQQDLMALDAEQRHFGSYTFAEYQRYGLPAGVDAMLISTWLQQLLYLALDEEAALQVAQSYKNYLHYAHCYSFFLLQKLQPVPTNTKKLGLICSVNEQQSFNTLIAMERSLYHYRDAEQINIQQRTVWQQFVQSHCLLECLTALANELAELNLKGLQKAQKYSNELSQHSGILSFTILQTQYPKRYAVHEKEADWNLQTAILLNALIKREQQYLLSLDIECDLVSEQYQVLSSRIITLYTSLNKLLEPTYYRNYHSPLLLLLQHYQQTFGYFEIPFEPALKQASQALLKQDTATLYIINQHSNGVLQALVIGRADLLLQWLHAHPQQLTQSDSNAVVKLTKYVIESLLLYEVTGCEPTAQHLSSLKKAVRRLAVSTAN